MSKTFNDCVELLFSMNEDFPAATKSFGVAVEFGFDNKESYMLLREGEAEWVFDSVEELHGFLQGYESGLWWKPQAL